MYYYSARSTTIIFFTHWRDRLRRRRRSSTAGEGHERRGRSSNSCATEWHGRDGLGRPVVCVRADSGSVCSHSKKRAPRDGGALYTPSRRRPVPMKTRDPFAANHPSTTNHPTTANSTKHHKLPPHRWNALWTSFVYHLSDLLQPVREDLVI